MEHILRVDQFDRPLLSQILARSDQMRLTAERGGDRRLSGRILATVFYEPSTRTRLSFESAMMRLGGDVISSEMAALTSSAAKGETIEDTVRIIESYADAIVFRHPEAGAIERAASASSIPIINGGDGAREHPTQALIDLYSIQRELGRVDELNIALIGDLKYGRAPRSLAMLLTQTEGNHIQLVSPEQLEMGQDVIDRLDQAGIDHSIQRDIAEAVSWADVLYMTRIQKERFPSAEAYEEVEGAYQLTLDQARSMKDGAIILHPLPRVDEIAADVDDLPQAAYFRQAQNGVYVRMALLNMLLNRQVGLPV
ncbi:MAG: aspartate carbamoyltransferase [Thermomicrobiales bacterium]